MLIGDDVGCAHNDRDTCFEKFDVFIDDSSFRQGETKTVMGGSHDVCTEFPTFMQNLIQLQWLRLGRETENRPVNCQ
jgi:hypothetical protein